MECLNAEGINFIPFSPYVRKGVNQPFVYSSSAREEAWMLAENSFIFGSNALNPASYEENLSQFSLKRAIFTIALPCTQILVVNSAACILLNYSSDELCSTKLLNLIHDPQKHKLSLVIEGQANDGTQLGSKRAEIVEFVSKDGNIIPASLFFKKVDSPQRCLAVVEALDRKTTVLSTDVHGKILSCDDETMSLFQYEMPELVSTDIRTIIPNICLDCVVENKHEAAFRQKLTGKKKNGTFFPLCMMITRNGIQDNWQLVIWVFINLNGLIILDKDLFIVNCNYNFTKLLFGANRDQVINQKITKYLPNFREDFKGVKQEIDKSIVVKSSGGPPRSESKKYNSSMSNSSPKRKSKQKKDKEGGLQALNLNLPASATRNSKSNSFSICHTHCHCCKNEECKIRKGEALRKDCSLNMRLSKSDHDIHLGVELQENEGLNEKLTHQETVTESNVQKCWDQSIKFVEGNKFKHRNGDCSIHYKNFALEEGPFSGFGRHWDGNLIQLTYKVKVISLIDKVFYCVWISSRLCDNEPKSLLGDSSTHSSSLEEHFTKDISHNEELTRHSSASIMSQHDDLLTAGEYSENYSNIQQIGKGAFGYVKMAFRHSDGLLVVTKFIKKHKINVRSWVYDPDWKMKIPLEISLLSKLKHPNIVNVLDVFHNDSFFQLVMNKHGAGMDLFEFIERKPNSDEKLNSYIFRQIISAVHYLDSIGILHRDIKDENVIINEKFEVKLIDFGSAAFKCPDRMFSVFYGTVEYCSPEVLQGNKYKGPELEIWALGVTLYVLTFGENPFYDLQETIKAKFSIPAPISSHLYDLIHKMLEKDVDSRITIGRAVLHPWITQIVDINNYRFEDVVHCDPTESDPPRYITEFSFDDLNVDCDFDRTMASSNSFCSFQTTENTENLDQFDGTDNEEFQEFERNYSTDDSSCKASTPLIPAALKSVTKNRNEITKSAGALNKVCENSPDYKTEICDVCKYNDFVKKRFSLDINVLKHLDNNKYAESESSGMKQGCVCQSYKDRSEETDSLRERALSRDTEDSSLTAYPEFYDTSDSRSLDGDESECFWDAENDKFKNTDEF